MSYRYCHFGWKTQIRTNVSFLTVFSLELSPFPHQWNLFMDDTEPEHLEKRLLVFGIAVVCWFRSFERYSTKYHADLQDDGCLLVAIQWRSLSTRCYYINNSINEKTESWAWNRRKMTEGVHNSLVCRCCFNRNEISKWFFFLIFSSSLSLSGFALFDAVLSVSITVLICLWITTASISNQV